MPEQISSREYFANIKNSATSIWQGMSVTLSYMFRRPITVQYPDRTEVPIRDTLPDRYRGFLEVDMDICTACKACERDCPIDCIKIDIQGKGKERVMSQFDIDIAKCMFCGLCTENCPTGSIQHTPEFEAAAISMDNLTFRFVPDPVAGVIPYKPTKGADSYVRVPLGSIVREIIAPWDAPRPAFPEEGEGVEEEAGPIGPSELAISSIGVDEARYAVILEEAMAGTDCGACDYPTCQEYSEAIAIGECDELHRCEPGGKESEEEVKQIVAAHLTRIEPTGNIDAKPIIGDVVEALKAMDAAPPPPESGDGGPPAPDGGAAPTGE